MSVRMRIIDIRETAIPLKSELKNSSTDFSEMTTWVMAVITDVVREGKPLHRVRAERYNGGKVLDKVFCYVDGGWYAPGKTTKDLLDEMRRHLDAGYTMLKMKVAGAPLAEDCARVEAVKSVVGNRGK